MAHSHLFPFKAFLGGPWAPERDSNGDSLSGAQLVLGTITNETLPMAWYDK